MIDYKNLEWREFFIGGKDGIFDISSSSSGIDKNKLNLDKKGSAEIPYITRSEVFNGINLFITRNQNKKYKIDEENVITIGLDTQTVFFQQYNFYTGQNIQILRHRQLNYYTAQFIIPLLKIQMEKFNWGGNGATLGRLFRTRIVLPADKNKLPNWKFMEDYIQNILQEKTKKYKNFAVKELDKLKCKNLPKLSERIWGEFFLEDIVIVKPGKRLTKSNMIEGKTPFIGSSDSKNGITAFISNKNASEDKNILGVNYNGSVVENFYHPYRAMFSDDVKRLSFKNVEGNKFLYLFLKNCILNQKSKYQYAYKFNEKRLKRQKIMLPVNSKSAPDYEYMEQYMMNIEYKKRKQYLDYLSKK